MANIPSVGLRDYAPLEGDTESPITGARHANSVDTPAFVLRADKLHDPRESDRLLEEL